MYSYELLKKYREKSGLTQEEVAKMLYIAKNTYHQYETGKRKIESDMFFNILKIYGLEVFFEEKNKAVIINELVADIYFNLKEKLSPFHIHEHVIVHIAFRIEEEILSEEMDIRWKDHILVTVTENKEDIYVSVGHKDIDFDNKGRRTGGGTSFIRGILPWEKEEVEESIKKIIKEEIKTKFPPIIQKIFKEQVDKYESGLIKSIEILMDGMEDKNILYETIKKAMNEETPIIVRKLSLLLLQITDKMTGKNTIHFSGEKINIYNEQVEVAKEAQFLYYMDRANNMVSVQFEEKKNVSCYTFAAFCNHIIFQEKNGQDEIKLINFFNREKTFGYLKIEDAKKIKKEIEHWLKTKEI
jgi:transcriptional regulator with XRE-family HTH domain